MVRIFIVDCVTVQTSTGFLKMCLPDKHFIILHTITGTKQMTVQVFSNIRKRPKRSDLFGTSRGLKLNLFE